MTEKKVKSKSKSKSKKKVKTVNPSNRKGGEG